MRRKPRKFGRRPAHSQEMVLQITSMADIFTIILVFLLKSVSIGASNITPGSGVNLPEASLSDEVSESMKLEISQDSILLDDKPITTLTDYRVDRNDLESDGTVRPLNTALTILRQRKPASVANGPANANEDHTHLMLLADRKAPYSIVKTVMDSAANQGFSDIKLVVVEDQ
jgi:biopolymer transport protein ExbD